MPPSKTVAIKSPRKLIEVALPLDKINAAAAREKSIRHGHPSTLHLWWARRPLAAARAVLFAQLVNDPGYERHLNRGINKVEAAKERERLFKIIEDLVVWENTNNEEVLGRARAEIWKSWRETCELNRNHPEAATLFNADKLPAFHDPFAGGGAIPLEAQRLGLEAYASDLNPVAVTINKAMIEIPPRFADRTPIGPVPPGERDPSLSRKDWPGATGLAEDVRRYGAWMRAEAEKRIGHLYPKVEITSEMVKSRPDLLSLTGEKLTVIARFWTRTVRSPNPAYSTIRVPLTTSFVLFAKEGSEAYLSSHCSGRDYRFEVKRGTPPTTAWNGTKVGRGSNFRCIMSGSPVSASHIKSQASEGELGTIPLALVAQSPEGRVYLTLPEAYSHQRSSFQGWNPAVPISGSSQYLGISHYGLNQFGQLFLPEQLEMLNAFADLIQDAVAKCQSDGSAMPESKEYSEAVGLYLGETLSKLTAYHCTLAVWRSKEGKSGRAFGMQTLPMVWDFPECNPFAGAGGDWMGAIEDCAKVLSQLGAGRLGKAFQSAAQSPHHLSDVKIVSTDPPYYDNVPYADLSDFFYVWLRRALADFLPALYRTIATPKREELVAFAYRHGDRKAAEAFFLDGMRDALSNLNSEASVAFPVTLYYAFKQGTTDGELGVSNSGWETFLDAVIASGFSVTGTWPMRTEQSGALKSDRNALASSVILVCRKRDTDAPTISRAQFLRELRATLPEALTEMTRGGENSPVAPVDLSQAIIGPGMGIFSRYKAVLEADGTPMSVKTALQLINRFLADDEFDPETQFCLQWFETNYWKQGRYGEADVAARAKGTDLSSLNRDGILLSGGGVVELLRWRDLPDGWDAPLGNKTPVWQGLHHLIRALNTHGEQAAGALLARMPAISGPVRTLSYRLYTLCERKGLAEDARAYNELIGAWAAIELAAQEHGLVETQASLFQS